MNTITIHDVTEQIYRVRKMYPRFHEDSGNQFYHAKHWLRKRLRSILGNNFVVIMEPRTVRVCYGSETVVI